MIPAVLPTYARADIAFVRGEGAWLVAEDGERYLDFSAGVAVNALGHGHPALVGALTAQAAKLWHVSNLYRVPEQERLAQRLVDLTFADSVFFTNSGTEACELAVKMARRYWAGQATPRTEIVAVEGAFHGRSSAAIAAAGSAKMTEGFGPLLPGFVQVPWADHDRIRAAITEDTAAVIVEPVQGEGGIRPLPEACLRGLREICDETGALLILDEVQCGMGRTGRLFAHEWAGIAPDIMMIAKGIGGGFPLGAVLAAEAAAAPMTVGSHGATYGGNPLGCAVGLAVLDVVADPAFLEGVRTRAAQLRDRLDGLVAARPESFEAVRGRGLLTGLRLRGAVPDMVAAARAERLLTVPAADNTLRLLPPLTVTEAEIDDAVARLDAAAGRLAAAA